MEQIFQFVLHFFYCSIFQLQTGENIARFAFDGCGQSTAVISITVTYLREFLYHRQKRFEAPQETNQVVDRNKIIPYGPVYLIPTLPLGASESGYSSFWDIPAKIVCASMFGPKRINVDQKTGHVLDTRWRIYGRIIPGCRILRW